MRLEWLGTKRLSWLDLAAIIHNCHPRSAIARAIAPDSAGWTVTDHLLAAVVDVGQVANWQRGGGKGQRPKPIKRPGAGNEQKLGKGAIKISEFDDWWEAA